MQCKHFKIMLPSRVQQLLIMFTFSATWKTIYDTLAICQLIRTYVANFKQVQDIKMWTVMHTECCFVSAFCTTWNRKWLVSRLTKYSLEFLQGMCLLL